MDTTKNDALRLEHENDPRYVLRTFAAVMDDGMLSEFVEAYDAALATLGLLAEDARDRDALDLVALLRHLTSMRAHVRAGQIEAEGCARKFGKSEGGAA